MRFTRVSSVLLSFVVLGMPVAPVVARAQTATAAPQSTTVPETTAPASAKDQDTELKIEEKANKQRAKSDKAQRKALKEQQKAAKADKKVGATTAPATTTTPQ